MGNDTTVVRVPLNTVVEVRVVEVPGIGCNTVLVAGPHPPPAVALHSVVVISLVRIEGATGTTSVTVIVAPGCSVVREPYNVRVDVVEQIVVNDIPLVHIVSCTSVRIVGVCKSTFK